MGIILYGSDSGKVSYNLNGDYKRLTSLIGIDDYTKNFATRGRVTILGDGVEIFKSEQLTGGDPAKKINVDLSGVLKLEVLFEGISTGEFGTHNDQVVIVLTETKLFQ